MRSLSWCLKVLALCMLLSLSSACTSVVGALFGSGVDVDPADPTPPEVTIFIADHNVRDSATGDFRVTTEDRTAVTSASVHFAVLAEDAEGVRFVELLDITLEPTCSAIPESGGGRVPGLPSYYAAPLVVVPGDRIDVPLSSDRAITRIPMFQHLDLYGGARSASRWCPEDRPLLGNTTARLRARAGNFSEGVTQTAVATLTLSSGGTVRTGVGSSGGGDGCEGEGTDCRTHPPECFGRGDSWEVPGTIECRSGEPVCVAQEGEEYCTLCGGNCGGCYGHSCSAEFLCAPGGICGSDSRCQTLLNVETSTGGRPCTPIKGFCWLPNDVGRPELICLEAMN